MGICMQDRRATRAALLGGLVLLIVLLTAGEASGVRSGTRLWAREHTLTPPILFEYPWTAATGPDGSFYVCGPHVLSLSPMTMRPVVMKYSRGGTRRWTWEQSFLNYPAAYPFDIGVDKYGDIYVAGFLIFTQDDYDLLLVKLSSSGEVRWFRIWEPSPGRQEGATAMVVTPGGAVYLAGVAESATGQGADFLCMRWTRTGSLSWVRTYDYRGRDDGAADIALDGAGGLVATGSTKTSSGDLDCLTLRLATKTGALRGRYPVRRYAGAAGGDDIATQVACGPKRTAYVALTSYGGAARGVDIILLKYRSDGKRSWMRRYDGPGHRDEILGGLAVDSDGNAYVAGTARHVSAPDESALAMRYTAGGRRAWTKLYRRKSAVRGARYADVVLDRSQRPYFGGQLGSGDDMDVLLTAHTRGGKVRWRRTYNGRGRLADATFSLATWGTATLYVSGMTQVGPQPQDYYGLVMKYRQ